MNEWSINKTTIIFINIKSYIKLYNNNYIIIKYKLKLIVLF